MYSKVNCDFESHLESTTLVSKAYCILVYNLKVTLKIVINDSPWRERSDYFSKMFLICIIRKLQTGLLRAIGPQVPVHAAMNLFTKFINS